MIQAIMVQDHISQGQNLKTAYADPTLKEASNL